MNILCNIVSGSIIGFLCSKAGFTPDMWQFWALIIGNALAVTFNGMKFTAIY